jgi:hypothetical protein
MPSLWTVVVIVWTADPAEQVVTVPLHTRTVTCGLLPNPVLPVPPNDSLVTAAPEVGCAIVTAGAAAGTESDRLTSVSSHSVDQKTGRVLSSVTARETVPPGATVTWVGATAELPVPLAIGVPEVSAQEVPHTSVLFGSLTETETVTVCVVEKGDVHVRVTDFPAAGTISSGREDPLVGDAIQVVGAEGLFV